MADTAQPHITDGYGEETRRDFPTLPAGAFGAIATAVAVRPLSDSSTPARDTLALSTTHVDLAPMQVGRRLTATLCGKLRVPPHQVATATALKIG